MQIIRDISAITPEPCVATIGFFDGVHAGHRYLIQQVKEIAAAKGLRSALVTFPVHPRKVMKYSFCTGLMSEATCLSTLFSPSSISIHYNGYMGRYTAFVYLLSIWHVAIYFI